MSNPDNRTRTAQQVFARISKGRGCELRVLLTTWRGEQRLEIREATATVPNVFMPTGAGVSLPIERAGELVDAITKAAGAAAGGVQK